MQSMHRQRWDTDAEVIKKDEERAVDVPFPAD